MAEDASCRYDAFISYRKEEPDKTFARQLLKDLEARGYVVAIDERDFLPNEPFLEEMERCVKESRFTLAVLSPRYLANGKCEEEAIICEVLDLDERKRRLVPLVIEPVKRPVWLRKITGIDYIDTDPLVPQFERLLTALGSPMHPPEPPVECAGGRLMPPPFERNRFFTGRERLLDDLRTCLTPGARVALTGMGGMGKTQTAVEFLYRACNDYPYLLYCPAETRDAFYSGFSAIARFLTLPEQADQQQVVATVQRWLAAHEGWLLVLDNVEDPALLDEFIPTTVRGALLLTTQNPAPGTETLPVKQFTEEEGIGLLRCRLHNCAPAKLADQPPLAPADQTAAHQLWKAFAGYPLALDQAGAYCHEVGIAPADYLRLYRERAAELLAEGSAFSRLKHAPVTVTITLALEKLQQRDPAAADLLRACAFLAPEEIPETIFTKGAKHLGPNLAPVADELIWQRTLRAARALSLLQRDPDRATIIPHRLVQAVLKELLTPEEQNEWAERVVNAVSAANPGVKFPDWPRCELFLPHNLLCAGYIAERQIVSNEAAGLLNQTAVYLYERARYGEAEPLFRRALAIREQAQGPDHPETATSLNNLAALYETQGRYLEAEPLYQRALAIKEQKLGPDHPATATSLNNLALLYQAQGRYLEAEPLYRRALAIREQALGPDHLDTAGSLNNLAELFRVQGRYLEAEPLYRRALAIYEQALGPDHPDTALSLNNLAALFRAQGRYPEAEPLYQRALVIREQVLGPDHPATANSLNNLASLYYTQGRYPEAEPLYQRALVIFEYALGPDHPSTRTVRKNYEDLLAARAKA